MLVAILTASVRTNSGDFPGGTVVKSPPANSGDTGSSPGPGRSHKPVRHDYRARALEPSSHNY